MNICIYGAASKTIDEKYIKAVEALGETLARKGHGLIFGGGASGMMGAAARGFKRGGADSIVCIAPSFFNVDGILYEECTEYVYTDTMRERKKILEERSDAFIVTPGGIGTLDEFFEIVTLRSLGRHAKPIILYNAYGFFDSLLAVLHEYERGEFINNVDKLFLVTDDVEKMLSCISKKTETFSVEGFKTV